MKIEIGHEVSYQNSIATVTRIDISDVWTRCEIFILHRNGYSEWVNISDVTPVCSICNDTMGREDFGLWCDNCAKKEREFDAIWDEQMGVQ